MQPRHIVELREMFLGEELVIYVQVIDPLPAPFECDPYEPEGRAASAPPETPGYARPAPSPDRPTLAEFTHRVFESPQGRPMVRARAAARVVELDRLMTDAKRVSRPKRRVSHAVVAYMADSIGNAYAPGAWARFRWHVAASGRRRAARLRPVLV
jgi:hypothetical protein